MIISRNRVKSPSAGRRRGIDDFLKLKKLTWLRQKRRKIQLGGARRGSLWLPRKESLSPSSLRVPLVAKSRLVKLDVGRRTRSVKRRNFGNWSIVADAEPWLRAGPYAYLVKGRLIDNRWPRFYRRMCQVMESRLRRRVDGLLLARLRTRKINTTGVLRRFLRKREFHVSRKAFYRQLAIRFRLGRLIRRRLYQHRRRRRRRVGHLAIFRTAHNIFFSVRDRTGRLLHASSIGAYGAKGRQRFSPLVLQPAAHKLAERLHSLGLHRLELWPRSRLRRGFRSFYWWLRRKGIRFTRIVNYIRRPHGFVRRPKRQRVKRRRRR
jgi:ribosomal protein S11